MATVLLLDDDAGFSKATAGTLTLHGHQVVTCERAEEARRLLARSWFDLLLVDCLLPDADGVRFVREMRAGGDETPAVLVSHFWKQSDAEILREGFAGVLHKPVPPTALVAKVNCLLGVATAPLDEACERAREALRNSFASELPVLIDGLRAAVSELRDHPQETAVRGVVKRRAHHLAGTAGTFGFGWIGNACAQIEAALFAQAGIAWDRIEDALRALVPAPGTLSALS